MQVAVLTDTNSGITVEEGKKNGIFVIPMPVIINDGDFLEGVNIANSGLYEHMEQGNNVSTSQPAPGIVMDTWDSILQDGYDEIVYIPMSSGLSNSCHNAIQLSLDYDGKVHVADNHRISVTLRESVFDAKHFADCGFSGAEIKEKLECHAYDSSIYIAVNTLEYLKKSGRVTSTAAAIATVLNVKPVLTIQGGKLDSFAKVRGMKQSEKKMIEAIRHDVETRFADIPASQLRLGTAGTFENDADAQSWRDAVQEAFPQFDVYYSPLSCSIACHVGINAAGIGISRIEMR